MSLLSYTTVHRLCLYIHTYRQNQQPFDINCRLQRHHQWLFNYNKVVLQLGLNLKLNKASLLYLLPVHKVVHYWLKILRNNVFTKNAKADNFSKLKSSSSCRFQIKLIALKNNNAIFKKAYFFTMYLSIFCSFRCNCHACFDNVSANC